MVAYDAALKINPDSAKTWVGKGLVHLKLGKPRRALEACSKAISIKPDIADAWYCKGMALSSLEKYDEALGALERALRINPDHTDAKKARASVNSKLGIDLDEYEDERESPVEEKPKVRKSVWTRKIPTSEIMKKNPAQGRESRGMGSVKNIRTVKKQKTGESDKRKRE